MLRTIGVLGLGGILLGSTVGGGCAPERQASPGPRASAAETGARESDLTLGRPSGSGSAADGATAVVVDGSAIPWASLRPALTEAAGGLVLEEFVLGRVLAREASRRGLVIDEAAIRAEEAALLDELSGIGGDAMPDGSGRDQRVELLDRVRRARGLGPERYESLLWRNAALRAIVRTSGETAVSEDEVELATRLAFGETMRVRLFAAASESTAARFREAVAAAPDEQRPWVFAERAASASEHPSAPRGGLIERFHPQDPAYPDLLGDAAGRLGPGELSPVLATASGFAVLLTEGTNPGRSPDAGEAERVERRLARRKERLAMERLARDLLARATVSPIDPGLARAWRDRP